MYLSVGNGPAGVASHVCLAPPPTTMTTTCIILTVSTGPVDTINKTDASRKIMCLLSAPNDRETGHNLAVSDGIQNARGRLQRAHKLCLNLFVAHDHYYAPAH